MMTPEFAFLQGNFQISGSSVPYFQLSLSARDALDHLRIARELIFDPDEIVLDELFQRDVDDERVQKEITPYLQRHGETKFFNAMVVVLLPQCKDKLQSSYGGGNSLEPKDIHGIRISGDGRSGLISWDPEKICPVIIDGQHRFSALREIDAGHETDLSQTTVPVILLALDERLGFNTTCGSLLSTVRKIFIDLNRQARTVSKTRNVLLDDRDLAAVGVRTLLESQVKPLESSLDERLANGRIPLALVDWYSDKLKFDQGIHLTSILSLYQIVQDFLNIPRIDPYEYSEAEKFVSHFRSMSVELDFQTTLAECEKHHWPFFLKAEDVDRFCEWFQEDWGPAITSVLLGITPYQDYIRSLRETKFLDGQFEIWAALDRSGKASFERSHGNSIDIHNSEKEISKSKRHKIEFQVVFQRSVLRAFVEMCKIRDTRRQTAKSFAAQWVSEFNERLGEICSDRQFWEGSLVRADGSINATRTAESAAAGLILLVMQARLRDWSKLDSEVRLQRAIDYVADANYPARANNSAPDERLRRSYSKHLRSLVRKLLQETKGMYGKGESDLITCYVAEKLLKVTKAAAPKDPSPHHVDEDPLLGLLN